MVFQPCFVLHLQESPFLKTISAISSKKNKGSLSMITVSYVIATNLTIDTYKQGKHMEKELLQKQCPSTLREGWSRLG